MHTYANHLQLVKGISDSDLYDLLESGILFVTSFNVNLMYLFHKSFCLDIWLLIYRYTWTTNFVVVIGIHCNYCNKNVISFQFHVYMYLRRQSLIQ